MEKYFLFPGQIYVTKENMIISTLLGSCIAVALTDEKNHVTGLNHYLLPKSSDPSVSNFRYADRAITALVLEMEKLGAQRNLIKAQIFGGASVIQSDLGGGIGTRNIEAAKTILKELNIPIVSESVGGVRGRTIHLNTSNGQVLEVYMKDDSKEDISGFQRVRLSQEIKVLIVDDSATIRTLFEKIFIKAGLKVVGAASDPYQAREMIQKFRPDVLTLDIEMPKMSGVVFLEKVMKHFPLPVVMVSSLQSTGEAALKSLDLGAVEFVHKPSQFDPTLLSQLATSLVEKVRAAAAVNVLKYQAVEKPKLASSSLSTSLRSHKKIEVITVVGNAGSAPSIEKIVQSLAVDTPPVVVCSSTLSAFLPAFIEKIQKKSSLQCVIAENGSFLNMGYVYFAPPNANCTLKKTSAGPQIILNSPKGGELQIPSADELLMSAQEQYKDSIYCILVSGFGSDGMRGVEKIKESGGFILAQNPATTQFPFLSQKSIELGLADLVVAPEQVAASVLDYRSKASL